MSDLCCQACGGAIDGRYINALGATWHPDHFVCSVCGRPIGAERFYTEENKPVHLQCYADHIAPRCVYCDKPLLEAHITNRWGQWFCAEHDGTAPECAFCHRIVTPGTRVSDYWGTGETVCTVCQAAAIDTEAEAVTALRTAVQWMQASGLTVRSRSSFRVELVGPDELMTEDDADGRPKLGLAHLRHTHDSSGSVRVDVTRLQLRRGMPSPMFEGTAVHELGHAWFGIHQIRGLPRWVEEGFCELLAYRWYQAVGSETARIFARGIAENEDPVYGEGFRRVLATVERHGWDAVLRHFLTEKSLIGASRS